MWRKILVFAGIIVIVVFFSFKIVNAINKKKQIQNRIILLPNFNFYNLQNQPFTRDSLAPNKSSLFLYFNTTCEHCQYETEQILKNLPQLSNTNVLFISSQSKKEILSFDSIYHLTSYSIIKLLHDSTDNFYKTFGSNLVPSSVIYNSEGKLIKTFKGEVKMETIIRLLK